MAEFWEEMNEGSAEIDRQISRIEDDEAPYTTGEQVRCLRSGIHGTVGILLDGGCYLYGRVAVDWSARWDGYQTLEWPDTIERVDPVSG